MCRVSFKYFYLGIASVCLLGAMCILRWMRQQTIERDNCITEIVARGGTARLRAGHKSLCRVVPSAIQGPLRPIQIIRFLPNRETWIRKITGEYAGLGANDPYLPREFGIRVTGVMPYTDGRTIRSDEELEFLRNGGAIERADFRFIDLSDSQVREIANLPCIRELNLAATNITDFGISFVARIQTLERLWISDTAVSEEAILSLLQLPRLRGLALGGIAIGDDALCQAARCTTLEELYLNSTHVTDMGLLCLENLPNLIILDLAGSHITDNGLVAIASMPRLQRLYVDRTDVGDSGLNWIAQNKNLKLISLEQTRVTADAVKRLQRMLPNCQIRFSTQNTKPYGDLSP